MKRGGLALAIVVAIAGLLRMTGTNATGSASRSTHIANKSHPTLSSPPGPYRALLSSKIREFYGGSAPADATQVDPNWGVPPGAGGAIRFVIATLPDPVHTHLGLVFDRGVEALQQAAQHQGYTFDRAVLPWVQATAESSAESKFEEGGQKQQDERESFPGLLMFRGEPSWASDFKREVSQPTGREAESISALFVLVVGESPTAGVRRQQFQNALKIIRDIQGPNQAAANPLLILGPSFSGSLQSLNEELSRGDGSGRTAYIYSGSVTGAGSIRWFEAHCGPNQHFASFQENDDYTQAEFVAFARSRGYQSEEIAVLSEDETVYGAVAPQEGMAHTGGDGVVHLHFPREISFFRSAYQKEVAAQQPAAKNAGKSTLPLELEAGGHDDDRVPLYGGLQTPLSQEAVMLGIVNELQKHHIKFTLLLATDPVDQLFLAYYLRAAYPQGRVVVTAPDLLLAREEDTTLHGVLGISSYSMLPGFDDLIAHPAQTSSTTHEDRLFVASLSIGTHNAMLGLLAIAANPNVEGAREGLAPVAPYSQYGRPRARDASGKFETEHQAPLLWLTILGRDGFWPIVGLNGNGLTRRDGELPVASFSDIDHTATTLKPTAGSPKDPPELPLHTPGSWKVFYCLAVLVMFIQAWFSLSGTILSNSEAMAQFAVSEDRGRSIILAIGGWLLTTVLTLLLCTRNPLLDWRGGTLLTVVQWLPLAAFTAILVWDFAVRRKAPALAAAFAGATLVTTWCQVLLVTVPYRWLQDHSVYWSSRVLHIGSGVSPVLPVLFILYAGYWWIWFALRGQALVDLRRPRLPAPQDLPGEFIRISDREAEKLRITAHPLFFSGFVAIPILAMALVSLTVLDLRHPLQTLEGWVYDWGYTILLGLAIAVFVGCLIKLVWTWIECQQVLAGLDRLPVREAFTRMKDLSWTSMWTPGGSTLRETYKVLSRTFESIVRLQSVLQSDPKTAPGGREKVLASITSVLSARQKILGLYQKSFANGSPSLTPASPAESRPEPAPLQPPPSHASDTGPPLPTFTKGKNLDALAKGVEELQKELAKTAAVLIQDVLMPCWSREKSPVVSTDTRIAPEPLPATRALSEESVALVYVNFLVSVLLRMRTMVICAAGMYVFIICSMSVYPFEPHPALQTLSIVMLLFMAATVGYVYAEMHRDAILSRLTSTNPGELGLDFWVKFVSAGAIPVLSLLASQFPELNQLLFSWLQPALQAVK